MQYVRVGLAMCAAAVAAMLGCDSGAEDGAQTESSATTCGVVGTSSWVNRTIPEQTGSFQIAFIAVPSAPNIDAVIGLSNGAASTWSKLAAIVRFNPQGFIDARAGGEYKADAVVDYRNVVGRGVSFRMDVDIARHVYSVWVQFDAGTNWTLLAREYPFRTEQASVTRLNNVGSFANPETGPADSNINLCGFDITTAGTPGTNCTSTVAGSGFSNKAIAAASGALIVRVDGTPRQSFMDGVIGVASGDVDAYNDLAASIRFWTNGKIEARDGDVYRADIDLNYVPGQAYAFTFVIDRPTKTYSVWVQGDFEPVALAERYKFRPQQATVARLDRLASVIASSSGRLDVCGGENTAGPGLRTALTGKYQVIPLADDGALITDGARTLKLAPDGSVAGTLSVAGAPAQDDLGLFYIGRITNGTLVVDSYSATLQLRWSRIIGYDYAAYTTGEARGVSGGGARFVLRRADPSSTWLPERILRVAADGTFSYENVSIGDRVALGSDRFVTLVLNNDTYYFTAYSWTGQLLWQRSFAWTFNVGAMAVGPDGTFVIGGDHGHGTDFGDGELPVYPTPEGPMDTYAAVFNADGSTRFSRYIRASSVTGVSSNGAEIALSLDHWTQFPYMVIATFDSTTGVGGGGDTDVGFGQHGLTYGVAIAPSGRLWVGLRTTTYFPPWSMFPVLVSIDH